MQVGYSNSLLFTYLSNCYVIIFYNKIVSEYTECFSINNF